MNFFEHQDAARKKTGRLILLFVMAVAAIVGAVYLIVAAVMLKTGSTYYTDMQAGSLWNLRLFIGTTMIVGVVIFAGSLYRVATLGDGGKTVAELLGGRLLTSQSTDWRERRLLNVVEEMALAAGMPVPSVYVMDRETEVNAFAAGFTPSDAVLGVTRGTMETLTRDELQGVIAHEFSHIFNGDMRLNLRLMGLLHGILLLSLIGYVLIRMILGTSRSSSRRSSSDKSGGGILLAILAIGGGLFVIGYIGVFFGKLIKSAVSRQREYLADASAVQFTRNPEGISGALRKIGAIGSRIRSPQAEQASHMYFGNGVGKSFLSLMSTHPPLVDRIRRLDPTFNGDFSEEKLPRPDEVREQAALTASPSQSRGPFPFLGGAGKILPGLPGAALEAGMLGFSPQQVVATVGAPQARHLDFASKLMGSLPNELNDEIHDPLGAAAVVYALLLQADPSDDEPGLNYLKEHLDDGAADRTRRTLANIQPLNVAVRLPLAQLTMTALRQLTPSQFDQFRRAVLALIRADRRVSLFEFGVHRMILKHLAEHFEPTRPRRIVFDTIEQVAASASVVLSAVARAGHPDDAQAAAAGYESGRRVLGDTVSPKPLDPKACGFARLDEALYDLCGATGQVKKTILSACAACIARDGRITLDEGELLRTIADSLDCPMPPTVAALKA